MNRIVIDEFDFLTGNGYNHGMDYETCENIDPLSIPEILKRNQSIYHYTATEGLKNILRKKELWFTHIQYLNDREEVQVGLDIYNQRNKEIIERAKIIVPDISSPPVDISYLHAYVCCFSLEKDALPMWNYYTKNSCNKGYNIGFDYRKLVASLIAQNPMLEGCGFSCGRVNYCFESTSYGKQKSLKLARRHNYVDDAIDYAKIRLSEMEMNLEGKSKEYRETLRTEIEQLQSRLNVIKLSGKKGRFDICHTMELIFYMKKKYFEHEKEFRIVINVPHNKFREIEQSSIYEFRNSNGILTPYLKLTFTPNAFLGITASPTNNGDLVDKSIDDYCGFCDIDPKLLSEGITHSKIPVRF